MRLTSNNTGKIPGELTELNRREQELLREYDKLAAGGFTVELEGGQLEPQPAGTGSGP